MAWKFQNWFSMEEERSLSHNMRELLKEIVSRILRVEEAYQYDGPFALIRDKADTTGKTLKILGGPVMVGGEVPEEVSGTSWALNLGGFAVSSTFYVYASLDVSSTTGAIGSVSYVGVASLDKITSTATNVKKKLLGKVILDGTGKIDTINQWHFGVIDGFGMKITDPSVSPTPDYVISGWPEVDKP